MSFVTADTWSSRAACRGYRTNVFVPPPTTESPDRRLQRETEAKRVCEQCQVRADCLAYALHVREPLGIWGGLTESERRSLLVRA